MHYSAIDLVPLKPITREQLMRDLCGGHARRGPDYGVGLGFYAFLRFHVDTTKFRRWNMDPAVANECPPIVRPTDIATVGQPITPPTSTPVASDSGAAPPSSATPAQAVPATSPAATPKTPERGYPRH